MKKITLLYISLGLLLLSSCTKGFSDLNEDPNRPKEVTPGVLLNQLQYRIISSSMQQGRNFTHELMQVDAPRSSPGGAGLHRYVVNPGAAVWSNFYTYLTDIEDIYKIAGQLNENNYKAIALIYKAWAYSILTDLYGDIPFSEATRATEGLVQPVFDKQKDIYVQILRYLDTANSLINTSKALTFGGDMVYSGTTAGMARWKKMANSLKLRLLLRISRRNGELNVIEQINAILSDPVKYPVFTANSDDCIFRYPGTFPYFNPYYNARQLDWRDGTYFTEYFVNQLNTFNDPRRTVWMTTVTVSGTPIYRGIKSGYPSTLEYQVGQNSSYNDILKTLPQLGVMITYSEVEFMKAELALKGFTTGKTAKQHYDAAISASMVQWGVSLPAGYLAQPGVAYDASQSTEAQLELIMQHKYLAYFFTDYQSWFEKIRTGYPVLPRGTGIPAENSFPVRVPYPTYLQSLNATNLAAAVSSMGGDNSNIKGWWAK